MAAPSLMPPTGSPPCLLALTILAPSSEGIVIKPVIEASDPQIGRLMLKQRSPDYLVWPARPTALKSVKPWCTTS